MTCLNWPCHSLRSIFILAPIFALKKALLGGRCILRCSDWLASVSLIDCNVYDEYFLFAQRLTQHRSSWTLGGYYPPKPKPLLQYADPRQEYTDQQFVIVPSATGSPFDWWEQRICVGDDVLFNFHLLHTREHTLRLSVLTLYTWHWKTDYRKGGVRNGHGSAGRFECDVIIRTINASPSTSKNFAPRGANHRLLLYFKDSQAGLSTFFHGGINA